MPPKRRYSLQIDTADGASSGLVAGKQHTINRLRSLLPYLPHATVSKLTYFTHRGQLDIRLLSGNYGNNRLLLLQLSECLLRLLVIINRHVIESIYMIYIYT